MGSVRRKEIRCHGIRVFNSRHKEVRKIRNRYAPSLFGNRVWWASWLLMDYLERLDMPRGLRIMEIGCGWGVTGIWCAKERGAGLTSVDADSDVYPYLNLHCRANGVKTTFVNAGFQDLGKSDFDGIDLLIGVDICFWEKLVEPLMDLVSRARKYGVPKIILADPGRSTFNDLGDYCEKHLKGRQLYWRADRPYPVQGQIIEVGTFDRSPRKVVSHGFHGGIGSIHSGLRSCTPRPVFPSTPLV